MLPRFADNTDPSSLASRVRLMRNQRFRAMIENLPRPLNILDVGGTQTIWETISFADRPDIQITLLNIEQVKCSHSNIAAVVGDARYMYNFAEKEFDFVYSNSVIEHVGDRTAQRSMANEIQRVGERYFVQTPYRYFPIESHFVFPLFQFLPFAVRVLLVQHFNLGWYHRLPEKAEAEKAIRSIQLLSKRDFYSLFPGAHFEDEKLFGITKSLLAYKA